jgi:hypothetical protein
MLTLPNEYTTILTSFARLFSQRIWEKAQILLIGAILTPGQRTVTAALRIMGLSGEKHFQNYHRVLNRAQWSNLALSSLLLAWLIKTLVPSGPVFLGLDDTIERRRGAQIKARGIYRDPVRSSASHFVKTGGLRWLSLMLLAPLPWAKRVWALPFLTALCPSERYYEKRVRGQKKLTDWARQMLYQAQRWLPGRQLVVLADASFAAIDLLAALAQHSISLITRFRLDAALYTPAPEREAGQKGRPVAHLAAGAGQPQHALEETQGPRLVRARPENPRDRLGQGGLVPWRPAASAHPLGLDPGPERQL